MAKEIPLVEGKEYTATLSITSIGGTSKITAIVDVSTPLLEGREDGDDDDIVIVPLSYLLIEDIKNNLIKQLNAEEAAQKAAEELSKPAKANHLKLATHNGEVIH